jgi:hypothetical protein
MNGSKKSYHHKRLFVAIYKEGTGYAKGGTGHNSIQIDNPGVARGYLSSRTYGYRNNHLTTSDGTATMAFQRIADPGRYENGCCVRHWPCSACCNSHMAYVR